MTSSAYPQPAAAEETREGGLLRIRLDLAYDGTAFSGWARQPDQRTVAGTLEQTLGQVLRTPIELTVAGRTDAGVHASGQVAHFDIPRAALDSRSLRGDPAQIVRRVSRILPPDVRVLAATQTSPDFDARFSALRRQYTYRLTAEPWGVDPLRRLDTAHWYRPIDADVLQRASTALLGLHNFAAFCRRKEHATTIRDLQRFSWTSEATLAGGTVYVATVVADAFCWSMVRSLVGGVLVCADGRRSLEWLTALLGETERSSAVPVAEARGLQLAHVEYPADGDFRARNALTMDMRDESHLRCC